MAEDWQSDVDEQLRLLVLTYPLSTVLDSMARMVDEKAAHYEDRAADRAINGKQVDFDSVRSITRRWRWVAREVALLAKNPRTQMAR